MLGTVELRSLGYDAISALLAEGGDGFSVSDKELLLKRKAEVTEADSQRVRAMSLSAWKGFFHCAASARAFVPVERIESEFGKTLAENYPGASVPFLNFATAYWTLKILLRDLTSDRDLRGTGVQQLLLKIEFDVASVFFPTPGLLQKVMSKIARRTTTQRRLLLESGAAIDVDQFIRGNPILGLAQRGTTSWRRKGASFLTGFFYGSEVVAGVARGLDFVLETEAGLIGSLTLECLVYVVAVA